MTIDQLIEFLQKQRVALGGEAPVTIMWDSALTDVETYDVQNNVLILRADDWHDSEHNKNYSYVGGRYIDILTGENLVEDEE